jgi:hypothetical protein
VIKKYQIRPFFPDHPKKRFAKVHKEQNRVLFKYKEHNEQVCLFRVWVTPRGTRRHYLCKVPFFYRKLEIGIYSIPKEFYKQFLTNAKNDPSKNKSH